MLFVLLSNALVRLFQAKRARGGPVVDVDASIRAVAANVWSEVATARELEISMDPALVLRQQKGDVACEVTLVGEKMNTFTIAKRTGDTGISGRWAVAPATFGRRLSAGLTGRRVSLGDPDLDKAFVAWADPPSLAEGPFPAEIRALLPPLAHRNPHLFVDEKTMTLQLEGTEMVHENLHAIWDWMSKRAR